MSKITKDQAARARAIADEFAKSQGKNDINEVVKPIQEALNNGNETQRTLARELARGAVEQLTKLVLKQELFKNPNPDYMDRIIDSFNDGVLNEGNSKVYDFNHATGNSAYNNSEFVPNALTAQHVDEFFISMYQNANGNLTPQGYQFRKTLVYIESKWIPYFKSGKLLEFISMLEQQMYFSWKCFIFNKIMDLITNAATRPKKVINGTGTDAFECWSNEILPEIRKMTTLSKNYNYNNTNNALMLSNVEDLIVFANPKTIQVLQSGIKSQLFNAQFLDLKGIIDDNNLYDAGLKLNITDENTLIGTQADYYIPENMIIVLNKNAIKHISQIDRIETAFYGRNLASEFTMHKWGAVDALPWGQGFVYINANLNTLP